MRFIKNELDELLNPVLSYLEKRLSFHMGFLNMLYWLKINIVQDWYEKHKTYRIKGNSYNAN